MPKRLSFIACGFMAIAALIWSPTPLYGQATTVGAAGPTFDVISIRNSDPRVTTFSIRPDPDRFQMNGGRLSFLVEQAYGLNDYQIVGLPPWARTLRLDVLAKADPPRTDGYSSWEEKQRVKEERLQALLRERFGLQAHFVSTSIKGYALIAPSASRIKLKPTTADTGSSVSPRAITCSDTPMEGLAEMLSEYTGLPIEDRTGLTGGYAFHLTWSGMEGDPASDSPGLFTALHEQLGLKLVPAKTTVQILHIDHVDSPTPN